MRWDNVLWKGYFKEGETYMELEGDWLSLSEAPCKRESHLLPASCNSLVILQRGVHIECFI